MKISRIIALTILLLPPLFVSAEGTTPCLSVADFDGDGIVTSKDIALLSKLYMRKGKNKTSYDPLFDRDSNGVVDNIDLFLATREMAKNSTPADQARAEGIEECPPPVEAIASDCPYDPDYCQYIGW